MLIRFAKDVFVVFSSGTATGIACHFLPPWLVLLGTGSLFFLATTEPFYEALPTLCRTKRTALHRQGGSPQDGHR